MAYRSTILAQLLKLVPRHEFEALAKRHRKRCRLHSMTRWAQFAALALGQLSSRCGLRDGVHGGRPLKLGATVLEADLRDRPDSFGLVGHFQRHDSRCRMWVPPEDKDPVLRHTPRPPVDRLLRRGGPTHRRVRPLPLAGVQHRRVREVPSSHAPSPLPGTQDCHRRRQRPPPPRQDAEALPPATRRSPRTAVPPALQPPPRTNRKSLEDRAAIRHPQPLLQRPANTSRRGLVAFRSMKTSQCHSSTIMRHYLRRLV